MGDTGSPAHEGEDGCVSRRTTMRLGAASLVGLALNGVATASERGDPTASERGVATTSERGLSHPRDGTDGTGPDRIHEFARWSADLDISDVPSDVVEKTELQIGNVLAAAQAGRKTQNVDVPTNGSAASIVGGDAATEYDAVFANTTYGIRNDYGSYQFAGHSVYGSVFPALAVSESRGLGADEFVENVVIANELSGRLGGSVLVGPNNGQLVVFIHTAAAAAIAARAGGDAAAIDNAVRLALYSPKNPLAAGLLDGDAKWFNAAMPAENGLRLGDMAVRGAVGASRALSNLHDKEAFLPFPELVEAWGDSWVTRSMCYKPTPGAAYVLSPLETFDQILVEEGVAIEDIESVEVRVPILASATEGLSEAFAPDDRLESVTVNYSLRNTLAMRAVEGGVEPELLQQDNLDAREDQIRAFADLVTVEHEWEETVHTIDALSSGIDFTPLIYDRGLVTSVKAVGEMDEAYEPVNSTEAALELLASTEADELLTALGQLGWDEFDMARADFDEVDFSFGCTVEVVTEEGGWWSSGTSYERSQGTHSGASARPESEKRAVVREKFESQFGDNFDVIEGLHAGDLDELTNLL